MKKEIRLAVQNVIKKRKRNNQIKRCKNQPPSISKEIEIKPFSKEVIIVAGFVLILLLASYYIPKFYTMGEELSIPSVLLRKEDVVSGKFQARISGFVAGLGIWVFASILIAMCIVLFIKKIFRIFRKNSVHS